MIKVLVFGALSVINGVASDEKLSQNYDTSVSLEPHESRIPYHQLNVKDGYLWNSNHGRHNIINQKNILPWEDQKHYSDSYGNRHNGYVHSVTKNSNDYDNLLQIRDDLLTYTYQNPHLQRQLNPDYTNDGYKISSALPMNELPILSKYNNFLPHTKEVYKSNSNYLDTHLGYMQDGYTRNDNRNTNVMIPHEKLYLNNIYNRNHDVHGNLYSNKLNSENILYNPPHGPEYVQHYNTPEELLIRPNNFNSYLAPKIDYENLNHDDPYRHKYLGTEELILGKNNHNSHITKSVNHVNPYYDGYKQSGVHIEQPLSIKESNYRGTPYINPNLYGNNLNNFDNYDSYRLHDTHLTHAPKLPGYVHSPKNYHHPYVNHETGTKYLQHGYSYDGPRQPYTFKDVAEAVKNLIHRKHVYYTRYHAHPRLRHYGRSTYIENVGNLMPHKERPNPYILPEYRRYNFNNEHDVKY